MNQKACKLHPVTDEQLTVLAHGLSRIDPWLRLGFSEDDFHGLVTAGAPDSQSFAISNGQTLAGLVVLRRNWLFGDYLRILAVLPQAQRRGVGREALDILCQRGREAGADNLWACVSGFNHGALEFYRASGFEVIGTINDLVIEGEDEILIRRRLRPAQALR